MTAIYLQKVPIDATEIANTIKRLDGRFSDVLCYLYPNDLMDGKGKDLLLPFVKAATTAGLKCHAWVDPSSCRVDHPVSQQYPSWWTQYKDGTIGERLCLAVPDVRDYIVGLVKKLMADVPFEGRIYVEELWLQSGVQSSDNLCYCPTCMAQHQGVAANRWAWNSYWSIAFLAELRVAGNTYRMSVVDGPGPSMNWRRGIDVVQTARYSIPTVRTMLYYLDDVMWLIQLQSSVNAAKAGGYTISPILAPAWSGLDGRVPLASLKMRAGWCKSEGLDCSVFHYGLATDDELIAMA